MAAARDCNSVDEAPAASRRDSRLARLLTNTHPEIWIFAAAILLLNLHLFPGLRELALTPQSFLVDRVSAGEWWRVVTHPFVHVTWLHLLLDASAFFLLYSSLGGKSARGRILNAVSCGAGSLLAAILAAPAIREIGLCGLSGVAHGLMASSALELLCDRRAERSVRLQGALCFAGVAIKSLVEVLTGRCCLESLGFGLLGTPVPACHLGGVAGGIAYHGYHALRNAIQPRSSASASSAALPC